MGQTAENFRRNLLLKMARRAAAIARPLIPSRTLRSALQISQPQGKLDRLVVALTIAHYWALYVHDGRGGFGPRRARVLVWFRNKADDPRTSGGKNYPVREGDIKRLTYEQFRHGVRMNRLHGSPDNPFPYMIISYRKDGDKAHPFFSGGLAGLDDKLAPMVKQEMDRFIQSNLFSDSDKITLKF